MFALLYLIFRRCAWMQYMKMGHSGTAGQGTLSPCALKGQIFSSQGHPYPSECDGASRRELRQFTLAVWTAAFHRKRKKINLVFSDHIKASSLCNKVEKLSSLQCWLWFEIVTFLLPHEKHREPQALQIHWMNGVAKLQLSFSAFSAVSKSVNGTILGTLLRKAPSALT